jgi:hypothetical protein
VSVNTIVTGYFVGLDLGQAHDHTALSVVRRLEDRELWTAYNLESADVAIGGTRAFRAGEIKSRVTRFDIVVLERLRIGTAYPLVVQHTRTALSRIRSIAGWAAHLVVDYTGVGRPVVDMLKAEKLEPIPLLITGGDKTTLEGGSWRVPKRDLVGSMQVLLQTRRLKIAPALVHASTLVDELLSFRVKIDPLTAHDSYGAWREGEHDDLVLATACACWYGVKRDIKPWTLGEYPVLIR